MTDQRWFVPAYRASNGNVILRQSIETAHDRPVSYCPGCGYYRSATGQHRADCTAPPERRT